MEDSKRVAWVLSTLGPRPMRDSKFVGRCVRDTISKLLYLSTWNKKGTVADLVL